MSSIFPKQFTKEPIMIGGYGRSGSYLMLAMLSILPNIFAVPYETRCFSRLAKDIDEKKLKRIFEKFKIPQTAIRFCEKTPMNVYWYEETLKYFDGKIKIINPVRDGRDSILSRSSSYKYPWAKKEHWTRGMKETKKWDNHPNVYIYKYEDLVTDPENTLRGICNFIGEEYSDRMLEYHKYTPFLDIDKAVFPSIAKNWKKKAIPISSSSIGRYKKVEGIDIQRIEEFMNDKEAVEMLKYYDYEV